MEGHTNQESGPIGTEELEQIVATYAPIGARQVRRRKIWRSAIAGGAVLLAAVIALLSKFDLPLPGDSKIAGEGLSNTGFAEPGKFVSERSEIEARLAEFERQIEFVMKQKHELDAQKTAFAEQSESMSSLLRDIGLQQAELERRRVQGSQLDAEITAIAAQRKALEQRWAQFEAQGELLAMEIVAVNAQRKELEGQRMQINRQQQELARLLEKANTLYRREPGTAGSEITEAARLPSFDDGTMARVGEIDLLGDTALEGMRGGFAVGDGMDVSFGFTQSGSINGVEQFNNNFTITSMGSMGSGLDDGDMSNMSSVILQNGTGNFVSSGVLDSLADSFGNVIQNTRDDQAISTTTIYDISLQNVPGTIQGMYGEQALMDALGSF